MAAISRSQDDNESKLIDHCCEQEICLGSRLVGSVRYVEDINAGTWIVVERIAGNEIRNVGDDTGRADIILR